MAQTSYMGNECISTTSIPAANTFWVGLMEEFNIAQAL